MSKRPTLERILIGFGETVTVLAVVKGAVNYREEIDKSLEESKNAIVEALNRARPKDSPCRDERNEALAEYQARIEEKLGL